MKILLINPLINNNLVYGRFQRSGGYLPPLGLAYIAAYLAQFGHRVHILDANALLLDESGILKNIQHGGPDLIGITATTLSYYSARDLANAIKKYHPLIPIVLGGPHVSGMVPDILSEDVFDFAVFGEGEVTMHHLVQTLADKGDLNDVAGLAFRSGNDVVINSPRKPINDLDTLPIPARQLLPDLKIYKPKAVSYKRLPTTHIFTSRGCPFNCIFCNTSFGKRVRFHSPEYVVSEIEYLVKHYNIREVIINDDTFIIDRERVYQIFELLKKKGLEISWSCNVRADLVDRALLKDMKSAGCWAVALGIESGSQHILDLLKKGTSLEQGIQACRYANEAGLSVRPSFIIGNPGETPETIEKTIRLAMSLPVHFPSFSLMTPFPGTEIWKRADEFGTFDHQDFSRLSLSSRASFVPRGLTSKFLEDKVKEAYRRVYLRPGMVIRHLKKITGLNDVKKMLIAGYELLS